MSILSKDTAILPEDCSGFSASISTFVQYSTFPLTMMQTIHCAAGVMGKRSSKLFETPGRSTKLWKGRGSQAAENIYPGIRRQPWMRIMNYRQLLAHASNWMTK